MPATTTRKHPTKTPTTPKTATYTPTPIQAAAYFSAKLAYETTPHQLKKDWDDGKVVILDVRDPQSYAAEHIAGAKNVPLTELQKHFATLPKNKTLVTYCWTITCALAPKAALALAQKGFNVQELSGGIAEWKTNSFPTEGQTPKA
ncbi:MAG TPA: rhodanese-like domain-containing protein [Elusimicrobiota bacterium]|nr:rhodanese-like domain-containing protein [Elusimicrobiota bacterium]